MLDIELFRTNLEEIIESEKKRFKDPENARKVLEYDTKYRDTNSKFEECNQKINQISPKIGKLMKDGEREKAEELKKEVKQIKSDQAKFEKEKDQFLEDREKYRYVVGNILHDSVPIAETDEDNKIEREVGNLPKFDFEP